ncbi:MAG TPA: hypothetical protein VKD91_12635 [Pyrinomonadaceae bacterium]|nr:hypothetical protein [Pyrinomonadaceae bacterium]
MRNSLVQQVDRLPRIRFLGRPKGYGQKKISGAAIKIEGREICRWWAFNSQFLSSRDFHVKAFCDLVRDLTLNREYVFQIAVIFVRPDVRIGARID